MQSPASVQRLRRFILDLAVRGKLIPQDPNDEPASELLQRIAKEKARLVKAGEIKRPKKLPPIDEIPYSLPPSWHWTRIREITSDRGQRVPEAALTYIDVTSIDKKNGIVAGTKVLQANEAPSRARKVVQKGDVLYSCVRPYLLNVAIVDHDFDPKPIASTAFAILNGHGLVLPRYLWIVLRSPFMVARVEEDMRGQAYPAINDTDFSILPFPLPPLAEQHRIVAKVDELMRLCDGLEAAQTERETTRTRLTAASLARLNAPDPDAAKFREHVKFALNNFTPLTTRPEQIKALRQTILNLAVRGKLVPQNPNDEPASISSQHKCHQMRPADVPGWLVAPVGSLLEFQYGKGIKASEHLAKGTVPVFGSNGIVGYCKTPLTETPSIIIGRKGSAGALNLCEGPSWTKDVAYFVEAPDYFDLRYLLIGLQTLNLESLGKGVKPGLSRSDAYTLPLAMPPLAKQRRIVAKVDELMALCNRLEGGTEVEDEARGQMFGALLHNALERPRH